MTVLFLCLKEEDVDIESEEEEDSDDDVPDLDDEEVGGEILGLRFPL